MSGRLAESGYGYFDPEAAEFVITRPDTPTPWINYLGEGRYGGIVSNTAGGFSFDRDPRNRRVSRYRYNAIPPDQPGRYIYLRRQDTGERWGATWQPVRGALDRYECRHGAGYTRITTERAGVRAETLYFVPPSRPGEPCPVELWDLRLTNTGERPVTLRTFSYVELSFIDAMGDLHNLDWTGHVVSARFDPEMGAIVASTRFRPTTTFFASDRPPLGWDCDREAFVGPYRGLEDPLAVSGGAATGSAAPRGNAIGSLCHEVVLEPGGSARIVQMLGITNSPEAITGGGGTLVGARRGRAALSTALRADWAGYLESFTVHTPDAETDAMLNLWNPVQCRTTLLLVALRLRLRDRARSGHGDPRQRPGHPGHRARRARPGGGPAGAALAPAVRRRPHLAPVPPPHRRGGAGACRRAPASGRSGSPTTTSG